MSNCAGCHVEVPIEGAANGARLSVTFTPMSESVKAAVIEAVALLLVADYRGNLQATVGSRGGSNRSDVAST